MPKAVLEAQGDAFWEDPVGSGPFKLKEWIRGTSISFEPNPHYWEEGKPYLDELRYEFIVDDNTRALKLDSGEAHVMESVPFTQIDAVGDMDGVTVLVREVTRQEPVWINNSAAPLDELAVRQALSYATDREAINAAVFGGVGTVPNHLIPPLKYNAPNSEVAPFEFDLDKVEGTDGIVVGSRRLQRHLPVPGRLRAAQVPGHGAPGSMGRDRGGPAAGGVGREHSGRQPVQLRVRDHDAPSSSGPRTCWFPTSSPC